MRENYWGRGNSLRYRLNEERGLDSRFVDESSTLFGSSFLSELLAGLRPAKSQDESATPFESIVARIFDLAPPPSAGADAGPVAAADGDGDSPVPLFGVVPQASPEPGAAAARTATASIGGGRVGAPTDLVTSALAGFDREAALTVLYSEDLQSSLVIDPATRRLLPGGAGDWMSLLDGRDDTLTLNGDFSAGVTLPGGPGGIDSLRLGPGHSYTIAANDSGLGKGDLLDVSGTGLGADDVIHFDGSAETDGRFALYGGAGSDHFVGGAGDDLIYGLGGADVLAGGAGADVFAYTNAAESTGAGFDTLVDFDPAEDRIDLPGSVGGFAEAVEGGTLSDASFDDDLAAALAALGAGEAVLFTPDDGDHAGRTFLVVDGNGEEGYQPGEDFVFAIDNPSADLGGSTDIFI